MSFVRVEPDDHDLVARWVALRNLCDELDDPGQPPRIPELEALYLRYGWDLEPGESFLYVPEGSSEPVGALGLHMPMRDNRHLVWGSVHVSPAHRRRSHGTTVFAELLRMTEAAGRSTIWLDCAEDDPGGRAFLEGLGFTLGSRDARRKQVIAELDHAELERLHGVASQAAADYELQRLMAPTDEDLLSQLVEVTAAINDAPMGDLTFEDEHFDLQRLSDFEAAARGKGERLYRVIARHKQTGEVGGHTVVMVQPLQPTYAYQYDTSVSRAHRGHKLGLLLKIEMNRWLAEVEPPLEVVETWNQVDNRYMIDVNEAIGYRLSRVFAEYELQLPAAVRPEPVDPSRAYTS